MSREIKFRAWVTNLCIPFMAVQGEPDLETLGSFFHHYCGSEQEKLMQFSGLRDKNGVEIYEGDIVKCGYGIGKIIFSIGCFMVEWLDDKESLMEFLFSRKGVYSRDGDEIFEVIGNIYENPELLTI